ncbi:hypothetical protein HY624_01275 [Candidatus Uhrbacteria bacterium]|nr:hypothetical protein [Candidatus Uhrbacteria bacterium]
MVDQGGQAQMMDLDELLVKGEDGKFYVLRGDVLEPAAPVASGNEPELSAFATRAAIVQAPPSPQTFIAEIVQSVSVRMSDDSTRSRLEKALTLFFKDLRNRLETKDVLTRAPKVGGVGLTAEGADQLLRSAEAKRAIWMKTFAPEVSPVSSPAVVLPPPPRPLIEQAPVKQETSKIETPSTVKLPDVQVAPQEVKKVAPPKNLPIVDVGVAPPIANVVVVPPPIEKPKLVISQVPKVATPEPIRQAPPKPVAPPVQPIPPLTPKSSGRPLIMDVTPPPTRAVGPVDELRYDILAFRRLGAPIEATQKILEKIKSLFRSSWREGMDGVLAWKHSQVSELVQEASRQSLTRNVSITESIQEALHQGRPMVNEEEWKACIQLLARIDVFVQGGK